MTPIHVRFDNRFNKATARSKRVKSKKIDYGQRRAKFIFAILFTVIIGGLVLNGTNRPPKTVQAQEPVTEEPPSRDTVAREMPRVEQPKTLDEKLQAVFGSKAQEAKKVISCEGGINNPQAVNQKTKDYGYFQVNLKTWSKVYNVTAKDLLDPDINIATAKKIYDRSGNWSAWYMSAKCHKLK